MDIYLRTKSSNTPKFLRYFPKNCRHLYLIFLQKDVQGWLPFLQNYPKPVSNILSDTFLQKIFEKNQINYLILLKICKLSIFFIH